MIKPATDFILLGSPKVGGTVYLCQSGSEGRVWTAYDLKPGGDLVNPRVVFQGDASWRGLPEAA